MTTAGTTHNNQRVVALVVLLALGILSLPVSAAFLDGDSTEDLVVPVQLVAMALVGAVVGYLLPGLAGPGAGRGRSAGVGAAVGLLVALLSVAVFRLLLG
jgi:hypothetical protein